MSTQVFVVTTTYGLVTLGAALADGHVPDVERRILLTSAQFNGGLGGAGFEATGLSGAGSATGPTDLAGTGELLEAFDAVHSLNEACAPLSPAQWQPRRAELPIWRRLLSDRWGIDPDDDVRLILPGLDAEPGRSLALLFDDATIDAYADGLTAYGPSRAAVDAEIGHRVDRLIYPELVPGLRPLLYREWSATPTPVSPDALRKVLARIDRSPGWLADAEPGSVGVVLGHHLSGLELLDQGDEQAIDLTLIRTAAARPGIGRVVYKVPAAAAGCAAGLTALTRRQGLEVSLQVDPQLPETWFGHRSIGFVGSCPGNPLATAHGLYGLPVRAAGPERVLAGLRSVAHGLRVPLLLADQLYGDLAGTRSTDELTVLVRAVAYAMQPAVYARYGFAAAQIATAEPDLLPRYLPASRLHALGLSGSLGRTGAIGLRSVSRLLTRRLRRLVETA